MQNCQVCGRRFDPLRFQIVVPELGRGFDRIECAQSARVLGAPGSRIAAAPLVAAVEPLGAVAPRAAPAHALRPFGAPAATLGLLAAGTAAAAFLWLRVVDTDRTSFPLTGAAAPPAFGHETVEAHVQAAPSGAPVAREPAEPQAQDSVTVPASAPSLSGTAAPHVGGSGPNPAEPTSEPKPAPPAEPSSGPKFTRPSEPSSEPTASRLVTRSSAAPSHPGKATGKGHPKRGLGHFKHGETDGIHSPGHGRSRGHGGRSEGRGGSGRGFAHGHGKGH